jgi:catechol 2,3-dioxygenase-like lactoylglutathione lyase family enzyme
MIGEEHSMGTRLTHIALHVGAIDACIEFYQRYCNLEVTDDQERGGRRVVLLAEPGRGASFVLQLLAGGVDKAPTPEEDRHFGFAVDSREEARSRTRTATPLRSAAATCLNRKRGEDGADG